MVITSPSIYIEKFTNGQDSDSAPGQLIPVGNKITWWYNVTNAGNVNLTNVTIFDEETGFTYKCGTLTPGQWCNVTNTSTAIGGQYANIGNVTADFNGQKVNDTDSSHYFGAYASIDIEKYTNGHDADKPTGPVINATDQVIWKYVVTNTGNVNLMNITVWDDRLGIISNLVSGDFNNDGVMEPGEVWTYKAIGSATEGQYSNVAEVTGQYNGFTVSDEDSSHYKGVPTATPLLVVGLLGFAVVAFMRKEEINR